MKKWILKILKGLIDWLAVQYTKHLPNNETSLPYNSLAPTDEAEKVEDYLDTIEWALKNRKKIKNIAIAGPYGSGKSSVIQTFQKKHSHNNDYHFLNISLATFKEEKNKGNEIDDNNNDNDVLRLIELSILQQLFYHEKDSNIPDSRFKKIKSHRNKYLWLLTFGLGLFVVSFLHLVFPSFLGKFSLFKLTPKSSVFFHYTSVVITFLGSFFMVFKSIRIFKGLTIKKFGVSNASIEIDDKISKSILNNHIDEILYFFEVTNYNIVIIEDLDRFKQTDVFTKLREINLLINKSKKIEKDVVFIYAIRDDMFQDKDRTKFFDFMIPIIPVINSSNSNEKLLKITKINNYKISEDLIEDLSLFIDDMRLLYNIMNEYHIYFKKLTTIRNQDKLLSMIVYKNIYPNDFTELSQNKGKLYQTIINKHQYIDELVSEIEKDISIIKDEIKTIELTNLKDIKELRIVYLAKYIEKITLSGNNFLKFNLNAQDVNLLQATENEYFELFKENTAKYTHQVRNRYNYNLENQTSNLDFKFEEIENDINSNKSYQEREKLIVNNDYLEELKKDIERLEDKKNNVKKFKIKDLISNKKIEVNSNKQSQRELINVLLRNGYIDEDYLDYISIFYEGSLSKTDHQFLMNVKTQNKTEFDSPLQKKENLIKRISEFEFEKHYILNYDLLDFLIKTPKYSNKRGKLFSQLNNESESVIKFIDGFIDYTSNINRFINFLCKNWINIWNFIENKSDYPKDKIEKYFRLIIEYADVSDIKKIFSNSENSIYNNKEFLSIIKNSGKLKKIIKQLDIKFSILNESAPKELLNYIYDNNFYTLSISNIKFFLKYNSLLNVNNFDTKNYYSIKESKLDNLIDYVEDNITEYIEKIYLEIDSNIAEIENYYIEILNNENILSENKTKIIEKVETLINDVNDIEDIDIIKHLLVKSKILATWENLINVYVQNENEFIPEITSFINVTENSNKLSKIRINKEYPNKETADSFIETLLLNDAINIENYSIILKSIPYIYNSLNFENLSKNKVASLINNNKLTTNSTNYDLLRTNFENLHISLVENNPSKFINNISSFELESEDLLDILESNKISIQIKQKLIEYNDTSIFTLDSDLLTQIGNLLLENNNLNIDNEIIIAVGTDSNLNLTSKIRLFNKWNKIYNDEDIETFLVSLDGPYSLITENGKRPLLSNNDINRELAENLVIKGYISKYEIENKKLKKKGIRISTFRNK